MKRITTSLLTLLLMLAGAVTANATKVYATFGSPASQGAWDAENNVYSWTAGNSNLMTIFETPGGVLADYTSLHLTTSDYTDSYRVCFMNGSTAVATIAFYSAGEKNLVFSERNETKDLDLSQITHVSFGGASASGSIGLANVYLEKPFELKIDENGKALVLPSDLKGEGCVSINDQTGVVTSTLGQEGAPTWGRLAINFPAEGADLTNLTGFKVNYEGDVLFNNFEIGNGSTNKGFWSNPMGRNDLAQHMTTDNVGAPDAITTWRWNTNTAGSMTIKSIELQFAHLTASDPHLTPLTTAMFNDNYCEYHIGEAMGQGSTIYGNGSVLADKYADLAGYDALYIYGTPGGGVRLLFNWGTTQNEINKTIDESGFTSIDLTALPAQQLNAFKLQWNGKTAVISGIMLYKAEVAVPYSYVISGSGVVTPTVQAALNDANATSIDATGVTKAIQLTTANPNCLVFANEGIVANAQNVVVDGVCANLVLTDGKPFAAPAAFTATQAQFSKTVSAAGFSTLALPFAAALPEGLKAYNLTAVNGTELTTTQATEVAANSPVLLKNAGSYLLQANNAAIAATAAAAKNGLLTATYAPVQAPVGSYVLQKLDAEPAFYQVEAEAQPQVLPFRAWLEAAAAAKVISIDLGETTGISNLSVADKAGKSEVFNLAGQRVMQPTKGLYIINGKKVSVK